VQQPISPDKEEKIGDVGPVGDRHFLKEKITSEAGDNKRGIWKERS